MARLNPLWQGLLRGQELVVFVQRRCTNIKSNILDFEGQQIAETLFVSDIYDLSIFIGFGTFLESPNIIMFNLLIIMMAQ